MIHHQLNSFNEFLGNGLQERFHYPWEFEIDPIYNPQRKTPNGLWYHAFISFGNPHNGTDWNWNQFPRVTMDLFSSKEVGHMNERGQKQYSYNKKKSAMNTLKSFLVRKEKFMVKTIIAR